METSNSNLLLERKFHLNGSRSLVVGFNSSLNVCVKILSKRFEIILCEQEWIELQELFTYVMIGMCSEFYNITFNVNNKINVKICKFHKQKVVIINKIVFNRNSIEKLFTYNYIIEPIIIKYNKINIIDVIRKLKLLASRISNESCTAEMFEYAVENCVSSWCSQTYLLLKEILFFYPHIIYEKL